MIILHHLNASRSLRVLWLLEEIGLPYEIIHYKRNPDTQLAPESLKKIHPLGKSPVIEIDGQVISESGAIIEYLIRRFASHLEPDFSSPDYPQYLQWVHFSESSAMVPILLKIFTQFEKSNGTDLSFLDDYTTIEFDKVLGYLEKVLSDKTFMVGNKLSGADFMLAFVAITVTQQLELRKEYPNLANYLNRLKKLKSWVSATEIENQQALSSI